MDFCCVYKNNFQVGNAIAKYGDRRVQWVSHGMLRVDVAMMKQMFDKPVRKIIEVRPNFI